MFVPLHPNEYSNLFSIEIAESLTMMWRNLKVDSVCH